jgi:4'-phosphopantetheinyl transferase
LGIDAERRVPGLDLAAMVPQVLAEEELGHWHGLEPAARERAFFRLWTLKEALLKATGLGFSCPPGEIAFDLQTLPAGLVRLPAVAGAIGGWTFLEFEPTPEHACAVAVRIGPATPVDWRYQALEPTDLASWLDAGASGLL